MLLFVNIVLFIASFIIAANISLREGILNDVKDVRRFCMTAILVSFTVHGFVIVYFPVFFLCMVLVLLPYYAHKLYHMK